MSYNKALADKKRFVADSNMSPDEIKQFIQDKWQYAKFNLLVEYKKGVKKYEAGSRDFKDFPQWTLTSNQFLVSAFAIGRREPVLETDVEGIAELLQVFQKESKAFESEINFISSMILRKARYSNKHNKYLQEIKFKAHWYKLKDDTAVQRYIRKDVKEYIEEFWGKQIGPEDTRPASRILPSKLLNDLLEGDLGWLDFCSRLTELRQNEDNKKKLARIRALNNH